MATTYFCPACFMKIPADSPVCPACGCDIAQWLSEQDYDDRLCHSLLHPESEVRMGALISLGQRGPSRAIDPVCQCLFDWPKDVVQGEEALKTLKAIAVRHAYNASVLNRVNHCFSRISTQHPSLVIRHLAQAITPSEQHLHPDVN